MSIRSDYNAHEKTTNPFLNTSRLTERRARRAKKLASHETKTAPVAQRVFEARGRAESKGEVRVETAAAAAARGRGIHFNPDVVEITSSEEIIHHELTADGPAVPYDQTERVRRNRTPAPSFSSFHIMDVPQRINEDLAIQTARLEDLPSEPLSPETHAKLKSSTDLRSSNKANYHPTAVMSSITRSPALALYVDDKKAILLQRPDSDGLGDSLSRRVEVITVEIGSIETYPEASGEKTAPQDLYTDFLADNKLHPLGFEGLSEEYAQAHHYPVGQMRTYDTLLNGAHRQFTQKVIKEKAERANSSPDTAIPDPVIPLSNRIASAHKT